MRIIRRCFKRYLANSRSHGSHRSYRSHGTRLPRSAAERLWPMTTAALPPGPKGTLFGGNLAEMRRDPLALYARCAREFGDFTTLRFGLRRVYLINHPDLVESVLVTHARNWVKHYALKMNRLLLGDGLLTSDGDFWLRQRRLLQPLFHRDRPAGYGAVMVE